MNIILNRDRKLRWYHKNKEKISEQRHNKRNEERIASGMPTIEDERRLNMERHIAERKAMKIIKSRKRGLPDPEPVNSDMEEVIIEVLKKRGKRLEQMKLYRENCRRFDIEAERMNGFIISSPVNEMDIFDD